MAKKKAKPKKQKQPVFSKGKGTTTEKIQEETQQANSENNVDDGKGKKEFPVMPVQEIIPIKEIYRGIIVTNDGRYIKILEVLPMRQTLLAYQNLGLL